MKKGDIVITCTSIKVEGKLILPGEVLEVGKDLKVKDADRCLTHEAISRHFEKDAGMSVEEMSELEDLKSLKVQDLKDICKHLGIRGYSSKKEDELIGMIEAQRNPQEINLDEMNEEELRELAKEEGIEIPEGSDIEIIRSILENELGE